MGSQDKSREHPIPWILNDFNRNHSNPKPSDFNTFVLKSLKFLVKCVTHWSRKNEVFRAYFCDIDVNFTQALCFRLSLDFKEIQNM